VVEKLQNYSGCGENSLLSGIHCLRVFVARWLIMLLV